MHDLIDPLARLRDRAPQLSHLLQPAQTLDALDSLDIVDLLCAVDAEFDIRLTDAQLASAQTFSDLTPFLLTPGEVQS